MLLRILLLSAFVGLAIPVSADRVWLNNGDRLSGDILLLDGGKRVLKTRYAGQVLIDWKDIDTLRSDQPLLLRRQELDREPSKLLVAAGKACAASPMRLATPCRWPVLPVWRRPACVARSVLVGQSRCQAGHGVQRG